MNEPTLAQFFAMIHDLGAKAWELVKAIVIALACIVVFLALLGAVL